MSKVKKGDRFLWNDAVYALVKRAGRDGTWADFHCWTSDTAMTWNKRQPLPLPSSFKLVSRTVRYQHWETDDADHH
jgi:hypothetical protein